MNDAEWNDLTELWASTGRAPLDTPLREVLTSHRRRLVAGSIGELAVIAGFAWLTYFVLRNGVEAWEIVWVVTVWTFVAIAVAFVLWNRRGTWRNIGESVAEFARLTRLRARRQRQSLRFGLALFIAEVIVIVGQLAWFDRLTLRSVLLLCASAIVVGAWFWIARRRIARELAMVAEHESDGGAAGNAGDYIAGE